MLIAFYIGQLGQVTFNYYNNTLFNRVNMLDDKSIIALYDCSLHSYLKLTDNENTVAAIGDLFRTENMDSYEMKDKIIDYLSDNL